MSRPRWKKGAILVLKAVLAVLVLVYVGRHVVRTWDDLHKHGRTLHVAPAWIALAMLLYLLGLAACGYYFGRVMRATATPVSDLAALRAYVISHLGKYVPGKAMVVVMRVGLVAPYGARPATAAFATLYETLVMSAGLTMAFLVVVDPLVFPRANPTAARAEPAAIITSVS